MKPFCPKSTSYLKPGHFWSIPIDDDRFGCGVVLALHLNREGKRETRSFLAGLLDWNGDAPPRASEIENREVIATRFAHIKAITMSGGEIIGEVVPWWEWPLEVSGRDDIPTAGYNVLNLLAKKHATLAATTKGEQDASGNRR
ncbi:hypothetical protein FEM03_12485 [Phragmitibacter flavus]|uniref:Uncharacterized protein n=1 Tax=Phragmitibacter flavus TaxID=2576071 RepID=A0A5R8KE09_9BACT|nr:hypothetical protein [Phragmitibacter flavus]TLD70536.1 hypothetical protein FEM03_12485 [Phragmitibacter flavus]